MSYTLQISLKRAAYRANARGALRLANACLRLSSLLGPTDSWTLELLGRIAVQRGDPSLGELLLRRAIAAESGNCSAQSALANLLVSLGHPSEAAEVLRHSLLLNRVDTRDVCTVASALALQGQYKAALEWFEVAASQVDGAETSLLGKAHCLFDSGAVEEALEVYESVRYESKSPAIIVQAKLGVAKSLFQLERLERAAGAVEELAAGLREGGLEADEPYARELLTWLSPRLLKGLIRRESVERADCLGRAVVAAGVIDAEAAYEVGIEIVEASEDYSRGLDWFRNAVDLSAGVSAIPYRLASAYCLGMLGRPADALAEYLGVAKEAPDRRTELEARLGQGRALLELGRGEEACELLQTLLKGDIDFELRESFSELRREVETQNES